jgi:hypothetical protein
MTTPGTSRARAGWRSSGDAAKLPRLGVSNGERVMTDEIAVTVDKDFARFGSKAYAINKINSVDVTYHHPHNRHAPLLWGMAALVLVLTGIGGGSDDGGIMPGVILIGIFCGFMAWRAWHRSKIREYRLMLATSSGSVQAVTSRNEDFIFEIRQRLERAIAGTLG